MLVVCGGGGALMYYKALDSNIEKTDPFSALTQGRPAKTIKGMQNILLVGTDAADPDDPADDDGATRTDTIILMHIPSTLDHAYLVSIPRDLYVPIPQEASSKECGQRRSKINAAHAWGGLPLLVKTVECLTSVRVDHVIEIDFAGFTDVVDALGGVDMQIEKSITSIHAPNREFTEGQMHLDGAEALDYVRQRKQFPEGDFARMRHQQELLKTLLDQAASSQTLTNPVKFNAFFTALSKAVKVDQNFQLLDMALQFRNLRGSDMTFMTSPNLGPDMVGGESVVVSDKPHALALFKAIAGDKMAAYLAQVSPSPTPNV